MSNSLNPGQTLKNGTSRIHSVLGQGTFGITYLAKAQFVTKGNLGAMTVEAQVAIKEFFMSDLNSRRADGSTLEGSSGNAMFHNYRNKFRKEAENLSKLSHDNIVRVFDVFDENGTTYYVMEFIDGQNLDEYIRDKGRIPEDEAIRLVKEIGGALSYMHSKKMLHLDLKPKNVMRRQNGTTCLIDFGLSKQFTEDGEPESSTSIGLGTPGYAPIEQSSYKQDGTFPATLDVYALGATLFKMLTGRRPPEATTIFNEGFPVDELKMAGVSANTIKALEKAMAPARKRRTQNVAAFLQNLERVVEDDAHIDSEDTIYDKPKKNFSRKTEVDETIHGKQPVKPSAEKSDKGSSDNKRKPIKKYLVLGSIGLVCALLVILPIRLSRKSAYVSGFGTGSDSDSLYMVSDVAVEEKVIQMVSDMKWASPLGLSSYTGEVEPDSAGWRPHGHGVSKITDGKYAGNEYDGEFNHGVMEGKTKYTQKNGDIFVGEFKENKYLRGRYTIKSSGEYFEGTFVNGQPGQGHWFDKNGNKI